MAARWENEMRRNRLLIYIWTGLLLCVTVLGLLAVDRGDMTLGLEVSGAEGVETIPCWRLEETAYFFVPSYAEMDSLRLRVPRDNAFYIDGIAVTDGMSCGVFEAGVAYPMAVPEDSVLEGEEIVFVKSSDVGSLFLETKSGGMTYLHGNKSHSETGTMRLYDQEGRLHYDGQLEKVSGRGQSTWLQEKKSYNITLARPENLLDMGAAANWVLLSNAMDTTNLRNKMVYDFAIAAGIAFTPECRWVDLYLNGEYTGLYLLCERIEVHPERVDIPAENSFLVTQDARWRFETQGDPFIVTENETALGIRYSSISRQSLLMLWQSVENAIVAENGIDPVSGKAWTERIDVDSWVKKHLLEEVFGNTDAMMLSQYYYLDGSRGDGKICVGPPWDYDLTLNGEENRLVAALPGRYSSAWFPALYVKEEYYQKLRQEYSATFRPLLEALLQGGIEGYAEQIRDAARMNGIRWDLGDSDSLYDQLRQNLGDRIAFLDRLWIDQETFVMVQIHGYDGDYRYYALEPGAALPPLPKIPENVVSQGWFYSGTEEPVDLDRPIYEDTSITLRHQVVPAAKNGQEEEEETPLRRWLPAAVFGISALLVAAAAVVRSRYEGAPKGSRENVGTRK